MPVQALATERAVILVKALPQPSDKYGETVCVAGLTARGEWRRLYPIRFRRLDQTFHRWHWIEYASRIAPKDRRKESRNVDEDSLRVLTPLRQSDRARFVARSLRQSTDEAAAAGESLTVIRPQDAKFSWRQKTSEEIATERISYAAASKQQSFFDAELKALVPCPYSFSFKYRTSDGKDHEHACHDWETSATFSKLSRSYGVSGVLDHLNNEYNVRYPAAGMAFAMGTHSQRPGQWLLIGVLRLDEVKQAEFVL